MKVREMIAELQKLDPEAECFYTAGDCDDVYQHGGPCPGFASEAETFATFSTEKTAKCTIPAVMF